jgi:hypothetical protein
MDENRFDEVIRELPQSFPTPPEPPLDEMWGVIEDAHFNPPASIGRSRGMISRAPWLAAAAALVIGVGIGRYLPLGKNATNPTSSSASVSSQGLPPGADTSAVADAYRDQTSHYLGQAAALLISLPERPLIFSSRRGSSWIRRRRRIPSFAHYLRTWSSCWCRSRDCAANETRAIWI